MNPIENMAEQADQIFERAEAIAETSPQESILLFRQGVGLLFQAYLRTIDTNFDGSLKEVYRQCLEIEPGFEAIEDAIGYLMEDTITAEPEDIVDAANEIWDFVTELISE